MKLSRLIKGIAFTGILLTTSIAARENISVPKTQNEYDEFAHRILIDALSQSQTSFSTEEYDRELSASGLMESLRHQDIDVAWLAATDAQNEDFNTIEIPVFRGALSYYLMQSNDIQLQQLRSLSLTDIKTKRLGLLKRDANIKVLASAGFEISGAKDSEGLFRMLDGERFDVALIPLFGNAANTARAQQRLTSATIVFAANPYFFTVHRSRPDLARAIKTGLEAIYQDGSLDQYMENVPWIANAVAKLESGQGQVLKIYNPASEFALSDNNPDYWLQPSENPLFGALLSD